MTSYPFAAFLNSTFVSFATGLPSASDNRNGLAAKFLPFRMIRFSNEGFVSLAPVPVVLIGSCGTPGTTGSLIDILGTVETFEKSGISEIAV